MKKYTKMGRKNHGLRKSKEYNSWRGMKERCNDPKNKAYKHYGGRGITVCDRWNEAFIHFYEDMGPKPFEKASLDRIDVNGNYCPENCRWTTQSEQVRTRHLNREGFVGVYETSCLTFECSITYKKKQIYLGTFKTELDAAKAFDDKYEEFYGTRRNNTERINNVKR